MAVPVVTNARVLFSIRTRGYGCEPRARHSLRPLHFEGSRLNSPGIRAAGSGGVP